MYPRNLPYGDLVSDGGLILYQPIDLSSGTPTVVDWGISPNAKRITTQLNGVSTNGASLPQLQLGDSSGFETAGYSGAAGALTSSAQVVAAMSSGFLLAGAGAAAHVRHGLVVLTLMDPSNNTWAISGSLGDSGSAQVFMTGGTKSLSDGLTQLRLTTVNGTDTFDAGSVNIMVEE